MIPDIILEAINRYVEHRIPTGGFLQAVLENNLKEAVFRADKENSIPLKEIVNYIYWNIPFECWGSPEKVKKWLENKGE